MSNKKSYMDRKNILSEGFFSKLIDKITPKSLKIKMTKRELSKLNKIKQKHDKDLTNIKGKIDKLKQKSADSLSKLNKSLEQQYGIKIDKKIEKEVDNFLEDK